MNKYYKFITLLNFRNKCRLKVVFEQKKTKRISLSLIKKSAHSFVFPNIHGISGQYFSFPQDYSYTYCVTLF
jgi:hypothetical protein